MKKFFFLLLINCTGLVVLAQKTGTATADSAAKEDIGTTPYGLPVLKSYVAPDVVERAKKKYGRALYSIEKTAQANCQESYVVGLIRNGKLTLEWMCDDPKLARNSYPAAFVQPAEVLVPVDFTCLRNSRPGDVSKSSSMTSFRGDLFTFYAFNGTGSLPGS